MLARASPTARRVRRTPRRLFSAQDSWSQEDRDHEPRRATFSDGIVESTAVRAFVIAALMSLLLSLAAASASEAQPPIRIGASLSQTGPYALLGQNQLRGYQLCIKHTNERAGLLGRRLELLADDDRSEPAAAVPIYEKLIVRDKVDAVLGPYSSPITEAVADLAEKHRMAMVAPGAAATSIFRKGRKFVFGVLSPSEVYLEGVVDMAARRGLRTIAIVHEDTLSPRAMADGTRALAMKRGLQVVSVETYPSGTTDFSPILARIRATSPDVLAAATYFEDAVAITRQMRELDVNPRMYGVTIGGDLPRFHEVLGSTAEFVYGATQWGPELLTLLRAGELIPVARRYPGARELVEAHRKAFPGAELSYHTAGGYGGCQVLVEAIRRAGSLEGDKLRAAILAMSLNTAFGGFRVDRDGLQIAHTMLTFQWQDGKKVIVWPDELAPRPPRFPTPPWSGRP
jgi:branched-chain amino acid transport system substrate-binding protein